MKTKLSPRFFLALTLFSLIGQVAWVVENMYLNVFIYKMFHASATDISSMVAASAVAATVTTVLIGALSDRIGKRKLFICSGYILWGISILAFAFLRMELLQSIASTTINAMALGVGLTITLDCLMTFLGSSANDAAFNAWVTDSTDSSNRGAAEGINAMMPLVAILAVFGGFMAFNLDQPRSWMLIFSIIGFIVVAVGILGCFIIKDQPIKPSKSGYFENVIYSFKPSIIRKNQNLYLNLIGFIVFNISIQIFMPYLILYYEVSLGMKNYVMIMAPAIIIASIVTFFWGKVYDKKGFRFSGIIAILWLIGGYTLLYLFKNTLLVFIGSLFMMSGYLSGMAVFGAKIRDLTPHGKAGRFQGIRIFSQVLIPGLIGPFIGSWVLRDAEQIKNNDGTTSFIPNERIFLAAIITALGLVLFYALLKGKKRIRTIDLSTPFQQENPWEEYPRPQLRREDYTSLCGEWSLYVVAKNEKRALGNIQVPFPPESILSGIRRTLKRNEHYIYERTAEIHRYDDRRILLHFGAVDQICTLFVNHKKIGSHQGGYLPFYFDITDACHEGKNLITLEVHDDLDLDLPYGKQRKKRGGMWYTPISGIWQSVWMEQVPKNHIRSIRITTDLSSATIETQGGEDEKILRFKGKEYRYCGNKFILKIDDPILWTPETPHLYNFTISSGKDCIQSYFGLRTITIQNQNGQAYICLNNRPYFFHGLLDQGYFSDGIYLPASPEGYLSDIKIAKDLGFNMLRKHIKIEPELFYYYCDKYGIIIFQDMVNNGRYHYLWDTVFPTIGLKKLPKPSATRRRRDIFENQAKATVELLYNHPSVCYYTIFNEGWGQYHADRIYDHLKVLDPTRIWDATSGWFFRKKSDVTSDHIYFKKLHMNISSERPAILSEFGGYSCKIEDHSFNLDKTYGYRYYSKREQLTDGLTALYQEELIPLIESGLNGAVLTQISDVEDETNGLITYDRKIVKPSYSAMQNVADEIFNTFNKRTESKND